MLSTRISKTTKNQGTHDLPGQLSVGLVARIWRLVDFRPKWLPEGLPGGRPAGWAKIRTRDGARLFFRDAAVAGDPNRFSEFCVGRQDGVECIAIAMH